MLLRKMLSVLVIQYEAGLPSEGSSRLLTSGLRVPNTRLRCTTLPCSAPSSRKMPCPLWSKHVFWSSVAWFVPCTVMQRLFDWLIESRRSVTFLPASPSMCRWMG